MVPVIKGRCWLPALRRMTHSMFSRPPQQQVRLPTCYCLWISSENGREIRHSIYWRAMWHSCPSRARGDSAKSPSRPWPWPELETRARWELYIQQVKSHDSAGGKAARKLSHRLAREQLLPLRSCHSTLITPNCIFMPALLCFPPYLLLKFYCAVSLHNPHSKCISPEFITCCHLPPDAAYHFAAVYGGKRQNQIGKVRYDHLKKTLLCGFPECIINLGPPPSSSCVEYQCVWRLAFVNGWTVVLILKIHCPWDRGNFLQGEPMNALVDHLAFLPVTL